MSVHHFQFYSPLPPEKCLQKLGTSIAPDRGLLNLLLVRPQLAVGRIEGANFRLRRNASRALSMATVLHGEVATDGTGSRVTAHVRHTFSLYAALAFWLVPAMALIAPLAIIIFRQGITTGLGLIAIATIALLAIACASILHLSSHYAKSEDLFLQEFVINVLDGEPSSSESSSPQES